MNKFSEFPLSSLLKENLSRNGFTNPTPIQAQTFEPAITGRDLVATAQTGTGKTLAFALPLIQILSTEPRRPGVRALILSPTRELAMQIAEVIALISRGHLDRLAAAQTQSMQLIGDAFDRTRHDEVDDQSDGCRNDGKLGCEDQQCETAVRPRLGVKLCF